MEQINFIPNQELNCNNKEDCINDLKLSYNKPGHPIAFSGLQNIYKHYKGILNINDIKNVLSEIENYTLHKEFHKGQRNPSYSHFKRYRFEMDLVDVQRLSEHNDGVKYLLTCIDTFTRYAFVRLLNNKTGPVVLRAFQSILEEAKSPPLILVVDRGTEFYNVDFRTYCENNKIRFYSPDSSIHGAFIERFNRTLQGIVYKYMTENETNRYIDRTDKDGNVIKLMPLFVQTYNNRIHRMTGVSPYQAENDPNAEIEIQKKQSQYHSKIKEKQPKYKIGDMVRISKIPGKFSRGYQERASQEIFKIHSINLNMKIPMYVLSNYRGDEIIKGTFYEFELVLVTGDVFRIERVLRRRKVRGREQIFVKWKGFDDSYNSWVTLENVVQTF
jgi:hypothetical protein